MYNKDTKLILIYNILFDPNRKQSTHSCLYNFYLVVTSIFPVEIFSNTKIILFDDFIIIYYF